MIKNALAGLQNAKKLLDPLNATDSDEIERTVRVMMTFERSSKRGLYTINQQLPNTKENSVHDYLQKWCRGVSQMFVLEFKSWTPFNRSKPLSILTLQPAWLNLTGH